MIAFSAIALLTLLGAIAAMSLRNLVHCALSLVVTFAGLAALYLHLNAQFIGFAQILVYIGAIAMLILFAVLLTRPRESEAQPPFSQSWLAGVAIAVVVFIALTWAILSTPITTQTLAQEPSVSVKTLGQLLMTRYVLPLEAMALLLTAALIGAVILAMPEPAARRRPPAKEQAPSPTAQERDLQTIEH